MQSERQDNIFEQFGEEIEEWARNAKSLINFFHNEYTVINSTSTYGDDFPKLEEIVDEYGDFFHIVVEYALHDKNVNPNEKVNGKTVFEHYLQSCIDGDRYYFSDMQPAYDDPILTIFLRYGAVASTSSTLDLLIKDEGCERYEEEEEIEDVEEMVGNMNTRALLINKLWNKLDMKKFSEYDWEKVYMRALQKNIEELRFVR